MFILRVMYQLLNYWNIVGCILMRMMCRLKWPLLLMYVSRNTRRIGFSWVDELSTDTSILGHHRTDSKSTFQRVEFHVIPSQ